MPNMSRNAVLKCAELAKPAAWAASVPACHDRRTHATPQPVASQRHTRLRLEQMKKTGRRQTSAFSQFRQRMRFMRFVTHALEGRRDTTIPVRTHADPEQFFQRLPPVANSNPALGKGGQYFDDGSLLDQVECGARSGLLHPRSNRRE